MSYIYDVIKIFTHDKRWLKAKIGCHFRSPTKLPIQLLDVAVVTRQFKPLADNSGNNLKFCNPIGLDNWITQLTRPSGSDTAQALSPWLPIAAARVRARVWSSGICGGQRGSGANFQRVLQFPLPIFIPQNYPSSQSPGAGTIGQLVADVPGGLSLDPTLHYAN
jgi:hypothetical protein